ncbi:MAG: preprotein translocase subunit YajC [Microbacteriaceae bacterium]
MISTALSATPAPSSGGILGFDPTLILLFGLLIVVIIFMFRSSRKRRADAEKLATQMVPGVEVMTQHGIFGTLISVDEEKNEAIIETTPGSRLRVHRQTLARVVEPDEVVTDEDELEAEAGEKTPADDPQFGERTEEPKPKRAPRKKPTE